ncbi:hypothetical protein CCP2SC5_90007 [Azospirillaceae bacterium]
MIVMSRFEINEEQIRLFIQIFLCLYMLDQPFKQRMFHDQSGPFSDSFLRAVRFYDDPVGGHNTDGGGGRRRSFAI